MFEYVWYVLNNLNEVPFYISLPIVFGILLVGLAIYGLIKIIYKKK